jgi:GNAT superfamily N-acetyltransferase
VTIREVALDDAAEVAGLSAELGYPTSTEVMTERIRHALSQKNGVVLVSCQDDEVVGWIDVAVAHHLQSGAYAEIGGLVVSDRARNAGIGRKLVAAAERWAAEYGVADMLVRSQVMREAAHRFYLRQGYERIKTSAVFRKRLST